MPTDEDLGAPPNATETSADGLDAAPGRRRSVLDPVVEYYSARTEGDLPWESGDAYLLGQLGRAAIVVLASFGLLYLLSPVAILGTGAALRVGVSLWGTAVFVVLSVVAAVLLIATALFVARCRSLLSHAMILQTDVPWREMVLETGKRLKALGVKAKRTRLRERGLVVGYRFPVRSDLAPLKVLGSPLGYITWGGAKSLLVVPLPLFRNARWGQDIDRMVRDVLAWERPDRVRTPATASLDEE
ncbi:MAG: hypothetical protein KGJ23_06885 [Euryarchaeota archaeon]|nr:hypothetical protein [Euryarchaeota archaeon]MDE1836324.1 hypothetical protein [Euryarchaeota archaeon]MDE1879122.1 hypothetical protein [Euryarchaeota archaeon]MDE2044280.1 hypothetical protein [Thermoplasmata archaeon]